MLAESIDRDGFSYDIADQVGAVKFRRLGYHHRRSHTRARLRGGLDLAEAHPVTADFDFIIVAAQKLQVAVRSPACEVSRPVTPTTRDALIGDEGGRRQIITAAVATGQAHPGDVQLAGNAYRTTISALVEHQQRCVVDRLSDRDRIDGAGRGAIEVAHVHRRLGGPVKINQPRDAGGGEYSVEPLDQRRRECLPTAEHGMQ